MSENHRQDAQLIVIHLNAEVERRRKVNEDYAAVCQSMCREIERLAGDVEKLRQRIRLADAAIRSSNVATLTDAEREAVERAIKTLDGWQQTGGYHSAIEDDAVTLRGLLERLGSGERTES